MQVEQRLWRRETGWSPANGVLHDNRAQLVLIFGSGDQIKCSERLQEVSAFYPHAILAGCSTAGEIHDTEVFDDSISITAIHFQHTSIRSETIKVDDFDDSAAAGKGLASLLLDKNLQHLLVFSDGTNVNGSQLVRGLNSCLPGHVAVTGGLSADGDRFSETYVVNRELASSNMVTAVGFYGNRLKVGYGSVGGWDAFGPERVITAASENILFEMDGKSALNLYKRYLGERAGGLPGTGLLFPLSIKNSDQEGWVVRTILAVDEEGESLTFAGAVPVGSRARLMKANVDRLIKGAHTAAKISLQKINKHPDLAILISYVGRKMVLKMRAEDEVESVRAVVGPGAAITGFYAYGEISPFRLDSPCELHNQTMTITTFTEI